MRDLLYRFRPAGAPGAAGPASVPSDRHATSAAELTAVFARLEPVEHECVAIVARAEQDAAAVRSGARQRAQDILAAAREHSAAHSEQAADEIRRRGAREKSAAMAAAQRDVTETRRRADERLAQCVEQVVESVRRLVDVP